MRCVQYNYNTIIQYTLFHHFSYWNKYIKGQKRKKFKRLIIRFKTIKSPWWIKYKVNCNIGQQKTIPETATGGVKKVLLKISQISQKNTCTRLSFIKQEISCEFCKIFKNTWFTEHPRENTVGAPRSLEGIAKLLTFREQFTRQIFNSFLWKMFIDNIWSMSFE